MSHSEAAVRGSAAWAAWGDALGFITELTDADGLVYRSGLPQIRETVPWRRRVGGRMGLAVDLPAGAYSDDTQLRLAVSRAIRGEGEFDVDSFARVEMVAWQAYALGAGRGSKAAAASLTRADAKWAQNFFKTKDVDYLQVGGNGAAMRIQPHVWAAQDLSNYGSILRDVIRDSVCTHGHPVGILGAAIHALGLAMTLEFRRLPNPSDWMRIQNVLPAILEVISTDEELSHIWLPAWELAANEDFSSKLHTSIDEVAMQFEILRSAAENSVADPTDVYVKAVEDLGGLSAATRGSGVGTALLALLAVHIGEDPIATVQMIANTLGSDTDSIATMAGAMIGCQVGEPAPGIVQDTHVIDSEARRLASIAAGRPAPSYRYPDPLGWSPPKAALDLVGVNDAGELELAGHGLLAVSDPPLAGGRRDIEYQWVRMRTGQTILIRRRSEPAMLPKGLRPSTSEPWNHAQSARVSQSDSSKTSRSRLSHPQPRQTQRPQGSLSRLPIDVVIRQIVSSDFDPTLIGQSLLAHLTDGREWPVERGVAFVSLLSRELEAHQPRSPRSGNSGGHGRY